jgi:hypothetical protein
VSQFRREGWGSVRVRSDARNPLVARARATRPRAGGNAGTVAGQSLFECLHGWGGYPSHDTRTDPGVGPLSRRVSPGAAVLPLDRGALCIEYRDDLAQAQGEPFPAVFSRLGEGDDIDFADCVLDACGHSASSLAVDVGAYKTRRAACGADQGNVQRVRRELDAHPERLAGARQHPAHSGRRHLRPIWSSSHPKNATQRLGRESRSGLSRLQTPCKQTQKLSATTTRKASA